MMREQGPLETVGQTVDDEAPAQRLKPSGGTVGMKVGVLVRLAATGTRAGGGTEHVHHKATVCDTASVTTKYAYIHGFASGPQAAKGTMLKRSFEQFGLSLELPDVNRPSFEALTFSAALEELDQMHSRVTALNGGTVKWCIVGSSMGSYLAARWAQLRPERVDRLVLLAPAFDFPTVLTQLIGDDGMRRWKDVGAFSFPGPDGRPSQVHWGLIADARRHPAEPDLQCNTLLIHGKQDPTVPIAASTAYAALRPRRVRLLALDDDHSLIKSFPAIVKEISGFFAMSPGLPPPPPPPEHVNQLDHNVATEQQSSKL